MIKSIVIGTQKEQTTYPRLMISNFGRVVLFSEQDKGVVINYSEDPGEVGYYGDSWTMREFSDFIGTVELSNE